MTNNDEYDDLDEIELDLEDSPYDLTKKVSSGNTPKKPQRETTILREVLSYVKIIVVAVAIAFICNHFIIVNAKVPSGSMRDTIMEGDRLIGFRLSYLFSKPERLDIVIFKFPDDETQTYIKRIIGLPGDVVEIKDGHVYVNGNQLNEDSYIKEDMIPSSAEMTFCVPAGHYFMMGDNRNNSLDSRYWKNTYVAEDKIIAKAIIKYYDSFELLN